MHRRVSIYHEEHFMQRIPTISSYTQVDSTSKIQKLCLLCYRAHSLQARKRKRERERQKTQKRVPTPITQRTVSALYIHRDANGRARHDKGFWEERTEVESVAANYFSSCARYSARTELGNSRTGILTIDSAITRLACRARNQNCLCCRNWLQEKFVGSLIFSEKCFPDVSEGE